MMNFSLEWGVLIWQILAFAQVLTVFSIIWFFITQIFTLIYYLDDSYWYPGNQIRIFSVVMVIVQYIVGIWVPMFRMWFSPKFLNRLRKKIQNNLKPFSVNNERPHVEESTVDQKSVDNNQFLVLI